MRFLFHAAGPTYFRHGVACPRATGVPPLASTKLSEIANGHRLTGNKGNQLHAEAPAKLFVKNETASVFSNICHLHRDLGANYASFMADNFDAVVMSVANFIRPRQNLEDWVRAIDALPPSVRLIVLGAGIQDKVKPEKLTPSTLELCRRFNDRAEFFGVRGDETREWLSDQGMERTTAIGCPSMYVYPLSLMGVRYDTIPRRPKLLTAGHLSRSKLTVDQTPRGRKFAEAFENIRADYVFQDEPFSFDPFRDQPGFYNEGTGEFDVQAINGYLSELSGRSIGFGRYHYFIEMGAWRQMCRRYDLYLGDRFHAGIAALQASVPAIILRYDRRVSELTDFHQIPSIEFKDFQEIGLQEAIKLATNDEAIARFRSTYIRRLKEFSSAMSEIGIHLVTDELLLTLTDVRPKETKPLIERLSERIPWLRASQ